MSTTRRVLPALVRVQISDYILLLPFFNGCGVSSGLAASALAVLCVLPISTVCSKSLVVFGARQLAVKLSQVHTKRTEVAIPEAPTFRPTNAEFSDPIAYVQRCVH